MNITQHIPASLILGSVLVASAPPVWAEGQGVGSVELIPFPDGASNWVNVYFSGDGQSSLLHTYTQYNSDIYQYQDGDWELIRRELKTVVPGLTPFGISADGSQILLSDFTRVDILDGAMVFTMPREWTYSQDHNGHIHQERVYGNVWGGSISDDGTVATMSGRASDWSTQDSLVWFGGDELVNLSADLDRDEYQYGAGIPSEDGSVIVFAGSNTATPPSSNAQVIWRWEDGQLTEVPGPDLFDDQRRRLVDMSEDGELIFGNIEGPARGGLSYEPLVQASPWTQPYFGQSIAWVWSQALGGQEIIDRSRFLETRLVSVVADGTTALLYAREIGSSVTSQYLWLGGNKFIRLDELFHSLNISVDADFYGFNDISDDGTKLMGLASVDGQFYSHAIIVTIPDLTP